MSDSAEYGEMIDRTWLLVCAVGLLMLGGAVASDPYVEDTLLIYAGAYIGLCGLGMAIIGFLGCVYEGVTHA